MIPRRVSNGLCALVLVAGCGSTPQSGLDAALPDLNEIDYASLPDLQQPDLRPPPRTLSCFDVLGCYASGNNGQRCRDQACFDLCDQRARLNLYADDARTYYVCSVKAFSTTCMAPCQLLPPDAGTNDCAQCVFGSCTRTGNTVSCTGGQCSAEYAACANDS